MALYSGEDVTFSFPTTRHPIASLTAALAILTAHRAGTATTAHSPEQGTFGGKSQRSDVYSSCLPNIAKDDPSLAPTPMKIHYLAP